jgi:hypothetical protein
MSKRLYQVMLVIFEVVYTHDFFGNRQLERIQNIKKDQERFKNKFFTYEQYLHLINDHLKENVFRNFSSLKEVDLNVNFYNDSDVFHSFIKKGIELLFSILKADKKFMKSIPKEFQPMFDKGIDYNTLVIVEIRNKITSKLEDITLLNGEGLKYEI